MSKFLIVSTVPGCPPTLQVYPSFEAGRDAFAQVVSDLSKWVTDVTLFSMSEDGEVKMVEGFYASYADGEVCLVMPNSTQLVVFEFDQEDFKEAVNAHISGLEPPKR